MGDRANIILRLEQSYTGDSRTDLYLYSHWGGEEFTTTDLAKALEAAKGRWDDEPYFNRIVIQSVFADLADSETGGGIALYEGDNEHPIVTVDRAAKTVERLGKTFTFEDYITKYGD
jgi:hypothetical protein